MKHHPALPSLTLLVMFALAAGPALAQKMTPGLWEYQMTMKPGGNANMDVAMAQMQQEMARMSPEQRQQMEQMMQSRGIKMGASSTGLGVSAKTCITAEQAARDDLPQADGNCKTTEQQRSGNKLRFKVVCTGEHAGTGQGEATLVSPTQNSGHLTIDTQVNGAPQRMEMDHTGRWLGADCGDVKPRR